MRGRVAWTLLGLVLLGGALRLFHLGTQSLWVDEAVALRFARYPLGELLDQMLAHHEVHPPLYDAALHLWSDVSQAEWWIRLPSALLGTLSVGLTFWLGRRAGCDARTSLLAAGLFAVSAFDVFVSQEAKSYALGIAATLAATALFAHLLTAPGAAVAVGYAAACVLGFYTHYLTALLWPCHLLAALAGRRGRTFWRAWVLAAGLVVGSVAPWLSIVWRQAGAQDLSMFRQAGVGDLAYVPLALLYGTAWSLPQGPLGLVAVVALLGLAAALAVIGARALGRPQGLMLALCVVLPAAFLFTLSSTTSLHIFWPKYVSFSLGPLYVLLARGLAACSRRAVARGLGVVLVGMNLLSLGNLYFDPRFQNQDWRSVVSFFAAGADEAHDVVVIVPSMMVLPFRYYYHGPAPLVGMDGLDAGLLGEQLHGHRRLWLCVPPAHPLAARGDVAAWLEAHGRLVNAAETDSVYPDNVLRLLELEAAPTTR